MSTVKKRGLIQRLREGPVICAQGFLFELERRGYCSAGEFVPDVALKYPDALRTLHGDFQRAGSDIVEAFTYNGHREKMRLVGKEELLEPLNRSALRIAKEVAETNPCGEPNLVAGNISNTNIWDPDDPTSQKEAQSMFEEMCLWAVEEGVDMIIGETFYYLGEALCALQVIKYHNIPCVITLGIMAENKLRDGETPVEACQKLAAAGADVVGLNCFRGPTTMMPYLKSISKVIDEYNKNNNTECFVAALPVPYRTTEEHPTFFNLPDNHGCTCPSPHGRTFPTALDPLYMNRYEIRQFAKEAYYELGIRYLGLCCGNNPMFCREVSEAVGKVTEASEYSEKMEKHFMYGTNNRLKQTMTSYGDTA